MLPFVLHHVLLSVVLEAKRIPFGAQPQLLVQSYILRQESYLKEIS